MASNYIGFRKLTRFWAVAGLVLVVMMMGVPVGTSFAAPSQQIVGPNAVTPPPLDEISDDLNIGMLPSTGAGSEAITIGATDPPVCPEVIFTFNGSTPSSGSSSSNVRSLTVSGVSVRATGFSRSSGGTWSTANVGAWNEGLGVEHAGDDSHAVDNSNQKDYLLLEFSQPVELDRVYLGWVSGDSDLRGWIGTFNDPYNNHLTLSDSVLSSFSHVENNDGSSSIRWADLNAGKVVGNAIVIAARTDQSNDYFKLGTVDVCVPPLGGSLGDRVWYDLDGQGDQDGGEVGINGVTVNLYSGACGPSGSAIQTKTTSGDGNYLFTDLDAGDYCVDVDTSTLPAPGYIQTNSAAVSDPKTVTLTTGQSRLDVDFGYVANQCLPTIDFETDAAGNPLAKGQVIDNEWAAWGITVSAAANAGGTGPAMIFDSANPSGGDTDLGTPNQSFGGPGVGSGGASGMPGENSLARGKILIISEDGSSSNPDDAGNGGVIKFTFSQPLRVDQVQILDIDDHEAGGTIKAYDATSGGSLLATGDMLGLGDNSFQTVPVNAVGVRRLEVSFPNSGGVPAITFCGTPPVLYSLGDRIWNDTSENGVQESGEPGIANVKLELLVGAVVAETKTTDASGIYTFTNLPAGNYTVRVAATNFDSGGPLAGYVYSPKDQGGDDTKDSDFDPSTGAVSVNLTANNPTIDGGFFENINICYAVADSTTTATDGSQKDTLAFLNRLTGATAAVGSGVGNTNRFNIEAIAFQPGGTVLYAADAGQLGTLNLTTGVFTATPSAFGSGNGSAGSITFNDVDGLSFDPTTGFLYGTHRRDSALDLLFRIDPVTGQRVNDAFGSNEYVVVPAVAGLEDVDDIAVDPVTGVMYAIVNNSDTSESRLVTLNKATGAATSVGTVKIGGSNIQDIEGLAFFNDGKLYGSSGKSGPTTNALYQINTTTAVATLIGAFTEPLRDFEGLECLSAPAAIVVEKSTNGEDADDLPGPTVIAGSTVTWTYFVVNTGGVTLNSVALIDDKEGAITCPQTTLASGASMTCTKTGIAGTGQYSNTATVTGVRVDNGQAVQDTDPSHYNGEAQSHADIEISKILNTPEPVVVGQEISYTIRITNTGASDLVTLPLEDIYDENTLSFLGATPAPDSATDDGVLNWSDLTASFGQNLAPGQFFDVVVRFRAIKTTAGNVVRSAISAQGALAVTAEPVVDGLLDRDYTLVSHFTSPPADAPANLYQYEGASMCYWALVVDRGFNDNVYADSDTPYMLLDGWTTDHGFSKLLGSDNAKFDISYPGGSYSSLGFDYLNGTSGNWSSGQTGKDGSAAPGTGPYAAAMSSLHWNLENSGWTDLTHSPAYDYNDDISRYWEWQMIYEFSIPKNKLGGACGMVTLASAHNSPSKDSATLGRIGDTVWEDVNRNGVQDTGEVGIPNVRINLYQNNVLIRTTQTEPGATGYYLFNNLSAGTYVVDVDESTLPANYALTGSQTEPKTIALPAGGADLTADFGYYLLGVGVIGDRVFYDRNGDGLPDNDADPGINGVTVELYTGTCAARGNLLSTQTTSGDGDYLFTGLLAGDYCVEVGNSSVPAGYVITTNNDPLDVNLPTNSTVYRDADFGYKAFCPDATANLAVSAGGIDQNGDTPDPVQDYVCVPIEEGGAIGDFVWWDVNKNGVQDAGEPGIKDVTVNLYKDSVFVTSQDTDASGIYTFTQLMAGSYRVEIAPAEFTSGGTLQGWGSSPKDAGSPNDDAKDSDGDLTTHDVAVTLTTGQVNQTIDFGFTRTSDYVIVKKLQTPSPVRAGEIVSFSIRMTNTGDSWITMLPLRDTFDPNYLAYISAAPTPNSTASGQLDWTDLTTTLGDLAPGVSVQVVVTFTATSDTGLLTPDRKTENLATAHDLKADPDGPSGPLGEVETLPTKQSADRVEIINPTDVAVAGASADFDGSNIIVRWNTVSEVDLVGFNLLRSMDGQAAQQVNDQLIVAKNAGASEGATYEFVDIGSGNVADYMLELVRVDGSRKQIYLATAVAIHQIYLPVLIR